MRPRDFVILVVAGFGLAGCYGDPFQNPGNWAMNSAPQENLNAQVTNKADLISGHGDSYGNGVAASAAIDKALGQPAGTAAGLQTAPPPLNATGGS